jgi:hypothetical protein
VLAAFTTEAVLSEHHHDAAHSQPHPENEAKPVKDIPAATMSGGAGRARSATLTFTSGEDRHSALPHIGPSGTRGPATDLELNLQPISAHERDITRIVILMYYEM